MDSYNWFNLFPQVPGEAEDDSSGTGNIQENGDEENARFQRPLGSLEHHSGNNSSGNAEHHRFDAIIPGEVEITSSTPNWLQEFQAEMEEVSNDPERWRFRFEDTSFNRAYAGGPNRSNEWNYIPSFRARLRQAPRTFFDSDNSNQTNNLSQVEFADNLRPLPNTTDRSQASYGQAVEQLDYEEQFGMTPMSNQPEEFDTDSASNSRAPEQLPERFSYFDSLLEAMTRTTNEIAFGQIENQVPEMEMQQIREEFQMGDNENSPDSSNQYISEDNQQEVMNELDRFIDNITDLTTSPNQSSTRTSQRSLMAGLTDLLNAQSNMANFTQNHNNVNDESESETEIVAQTAENTGIARHRRTPRARRVVPDFMNWGFHFQQQMPQLPREFPAPIEHAQGSREYKRQRALEKGKVPKHFRNVSPGTAKYFKQYGINAGSEADGDPSYYDNPFNDIFIVPDPITSYPEVDLLGDDTPFSLLDHPNPYKEDNEKLIASEEDEEEDNTLTAENCEDKENNERELDTDDDIDDLTEEEEAIWNEMVHNWTLDDNSPYPPRIELDEEDLHVEDFLVQTKNKLKDNNMMNKPNTPDILDCSEVDNEGIQTSIISPNQNYETHMLENSGTGSEDKHSD